VLTESDNFEYANGTRAAAAAPAQSSPPLPSQPVREPETGLRYMLAMRQLDCEIGRLRSPRLIDIASGADVKPDILKDLLKVDVPDVRKSVDRARDALKTAEEGGKNRLGSRAFPSLHSFPPFNFAFPMSPLLRQSTNASCLVIAS
jgi:hypothetical protein